LKADDDEFVLEDNSPSPNKDDEDMSPNSRKKNKRLVIKDGNKEK
jgi:hypothetical protein